MSQDDNEAKRTSWAHKAAERIVDGILAARLNATRPRTEPPCFVRLIEGPFGICPIRAANFKNSPVTSTSKPFASHIHSMTIRPAGNRGDAGPRPRASSALRYSDRTAK
jgi:hypothetical protein